MKERLLLVEDDPANRRLATHALEEAGFSVKGVGTGHEALHALGGNDITLVILDLTLRDIDGLDLCKIIRANSAVPVLVLTGRAETTDVVVGLEMGADDCITKPFQTPELVARARALLRRAMRFTEERLIRLEGLDIDPWTYRVSKGGREVPLTRTEFHLLVELARNPGRVLSRDALLQRVWKTDYLGNSRLIDMAIKRLREKIEDDPGDPTLITTIRGVGYKLEAAPAGKVV